MTLTLPKRAAVASVRTVTPTAAELKARATEIKSELPALNAARAALSVAYSAGDVEAIKASDEIDAARAKLLAEQEHLDIAIKEVSALERANPVLPWHQLDRLKHTLRATVIERRESFVFTLQRKDDRYPLTAHELSMRFNDSDPLTIAREIVQPIVKQVVAYDGEERARMTAERNRAIDKLARELVEATQLPPVPEIIAKVSAP